MNEPAIASPAALALCLLVGCAAVSEQQHDLPAGEDSAVTIKAFAEVEGDRHLVGGLGVRIQPLDSTGAATTAETRDDEPLLIRDLAPGRYRVSLSADRSSFSRELTLSPASRVTLKIDLKAVATYGGPDAGDAALHVVKEGAFYVLGGLFYVSVSILDAAISGAAEDDEEDEDPWVWERAPDDDRPSAWHERRRAEDD